MKLHILIGLLTTVLVCYTQAYSLANIVEDIGAIKQKIFSFNFNTNFPEITDLKLLNYNDKITKFILEIDQRNSSSYIVNLNENNIKHYTQHSSDDSLHLEQYVGNYVIRLSKWKDDSGFFQMALLTAHQMNLKIWEKSIPHRFIDIQVDKTQGIDLLSILTKSYSKERDFKSSIMIIDLPQTIFETLPQSDSDFSSDDLNIEALSINTELFFKYYRDLDTIYAWFDLLVSSYPDILTVEWIGQTFEGRDMKALRLSVHSNSKSDSIKTVVITGGIHAREWVSVSTSCYILYNLLADYEAGDPRVVKYLKKLDFFFLPVMNPDGYAYTWNSERLWRKNRQETYHPRCFGIDIDHSFDFHFTKSYESPCSEDYSGEGAFESLESYNWDKYLNETKHSHPIYAYIDLHSYAEEVLYPYAYTCDILPRDEENLLELAYGLRQAIRLNSGKAYDVISACQDKGADLLPNMGAGSALDYMYHNKAYWAFVLKLRDSGNHGFLLPSKYIVPVGGEIYSSVKYFASFLLADN